MPLSPDLRDFTYYCDSFRFSALFTVYFFGKGSILSTAELLVATLLGILLFHEEVTIYNLLGMASIFAAILLLNRPPKKEAK